MNGIHEVVGSIPISSTNDIKRLAEIGYPFFIPDVTQGAQGYNKECYSWDETSPSTSS